ncbi:MAG: MFS transporter, partial [Planctomycetia bacterium]
VASLGWVFDAFEGQIYSVTRADMLPDLLGTAADAPEVRLWGERFLGIFLIGGTLGGWIFSSLADRVGRNPVMALTILFYSCFSGLTALATEAWHVGLLRFLVAMGVGGEWAVGAALVSEEFPRRARERAAGIFHATSVGGLWLAAAASLAVGANWRIAYLLGLAPALLVLWVRLSIREPEAWRAARARRPDRLGSFRELLGDPTWRPRAVFGALLAMVGLATFWGVVVAGQDIAADVLKRAGDPAWQSKSKIACGFVQTAGAGIGMLAFGPLAARIGCRGAFALMHVAAAVLTPVVCFLPSLVGGYPLLLVLLPIFGFFAQGIHAGYAVYFPTLFPTHLRATGSGFCFNTGRILAAPVLIWLSAWMKATLDLRLAVSLLGTLFLLGLVFLLRLPETRGAELPD